MVDGARWAQALQVRYDKQWDFYINQVTKKRSDRGKIDGTTSSPSASELSERISQFM
jgi:hypothetical protein